jgi:hypothetical protein
MELTLRRVDEVHRSSLSTWLNGAWPGHASTEGQSRKQFDPQIAADYRSLKS